MADDAVHQSESRSRVASRASSTRVRIKQIGEEQAGRHVFTLDVVQGPVPQVIRSRLCGHTCEPSVPLDVDEFGRVVHAGRDVRGSTGSP